LCLLCGESKLGKKGFVFTLDVMVGMIVVFMVILISLFFVSRGSEAGLSEQYLLRVGSDILTVMDEQEVFDSLDHLTIEDEMNELLPGNYGMLIRLQGDFDAGNGTIEVGGEMPEQRLIVSGQRVALINDDTYLKITYFVWAREQ